MRPLLIVNPAAGGGRAGRTLAALEPIAERALGPVDLAITTGTGHAIALAREAAAGGRELVVAVGGDGTLHEVANGVLEASEGAPGATAVGFIAEGTGGDFRKSLGIPHRLDRYLEAIASGRERRIDAGRATFRTSDGGAGARWFVNVLSVGVGGLVDRFVGDAPPALPPAGAYAWAALRAVAESDATPLTCVVERAGERTERVLEAWSMAICNGTTFGGGMRVAPMAAVSDGRFEVVALGAPSKLAFLRLARKLYTASHLGEPGTVHLAGDRVDISPANESRPRKVFLDIDGEPLGELPLRVALVPGALRVRA